MMPNLNLLVMLNSYSDSRSSNAPSMNNFKWTREIDGIQITSENSQSLQVPANGSVTLLTGDNKSFIYIEADQICNLTINGVALSALSLRPVTINSTVYPGVFMLNATVTSLSIANTSGTAANVFFAAVG